MTPAERSGAGTDDPFGLARFVRAQDAGGTWNDALSELAAGRKRTHWMWFVFPQIAGLGRSDMARRYALRSVEEARAYAEHDVLGARLRSACDALLSLPGDASATRVMGDVDAMKLRSSMTLFERSDALDARPARVLDRYFRGERDPATLALLATSV